MGKAKCKCPPQGAPAWMATFADMATLLMSFFVLLLAFSEMDVEKYKSVAGSMKRALGVKSETYEVTLPQGDPADEPEIRSEPRSGLDAQAEVAEAFEQIREDLKEEIHKGSVDVERKNDTIIVRIMESNAFKSGSADLNKTFVPIVHKIRDVYRSYPGKVAVAGHTDDRKVGGRRWRSNWDLSASRASSVVIELTGPDGLADHRVVAQGYGASRPLVENVDAESRAKNRRVDVVLIIPKPDTEGMGTGGENVPGWLQPRE